MNFTDMLADLDVAVEDHLCDDAAYQVQGIGPLIPVRIMINAPSELERMQNAGFTRSRPVLSASADAIPGLRSGDLFFMGRWVSDTVFVPAAETWRLAEAPSRPDDGRWWRGEVEPL